MDKSTFGIHEIKFVIKTSPGLSNGSSVGQHTDSTLDLGQVTSWNNSRWLVVDTNFETSGTPVNELDCTFGLDGSNGSIYILRDNITTEKETASHVLAMSRIAFHHLVSWFKASISDFSYTKLLMVSFLGRDDGSISNKREVDTWVWYQIGLELSKIDIKGTIKTKRGSDG